VGGGGKEGWILNADPGVDCEVCEFWDNVLGGVEVDWGVVGVVNASLCSLYTNDLPDALRILLENLRAEPGRYLVHEVCFNLCTLYDLCEGGGREAKELVKYTTKEWGAEIEGSAFRL